MSKATATNPPAAEAPAPAAPAKPAKSAFDLLVAAKMSAGLPRKTAEFCAQQQLDHDAALEAAEKAAAKSAKK